MENDIDKTISSEPGINSRFLFVLTGSMAAIAASGMIYELVIATISGYILGDTVTHFSIVVGVFLCSMGLGAAISRKVMTDLIRMFLVVELWLGFFGIIASPSLLYIGFVFDSKVIYFIAMLIFTGSIGTFVGLEIPLISRYLEKYSGTRKALSNVLTADYIGSLVGAVAFPLCLFPVVGLIGTAAVAGIINIIVALVIISLFRERLKIRLYIGAVSVVLLCCLTGMLFVREPLFNMFEERGYRDTIIYREQSPFQRIILTRGKRQGSAPTGYMPRRWKDDFRLFLDGHLQFSSLDEYRYHESLVHPAMSLHRAPKKVLILGGGDGLAATQVFSYPGVSGITLVDIDSRITDLARSHKTFTKLNKNSLNDPRMDVVIGDAFNYVRHTKKQFDIIISDLPDPHSATLSRLYSKEFYMLLRKRLRPGGFFVSQSTSPFFAQRAYWSIGESLRAAGFRVASYHVNVPSFGDWGFHLSGKSLFDTELISLRVPTRFLTDELIQSLFVFGKDAGPVPVEVNTLDNVKLYAYYQDSEWE
ncbi:MAG: polyamine aminopropyltransferase [bacterium]|nr:polyamine aminopropyltransferase [bacterium]